MKCSGCHESCLEELVVYPRPYKGGMLHVVDVPFTSCGCDSWYILGDLSIAGFYARLLEKHQMTGEYVVSLTALKAVYSIELVLDYSFAERKV